MNRSRPPRLARSIAALWLCASPSLAVDGDRDPTFSNDGRAFFSWAGGDSTEQGYLLAELEGGALLVGGDAVGNRGSFAVLRAQSALIFTDGFERGSRTAWS